MKCYQLLSELKLTEQQHVKRQRLRVYQKPACSLCSLA